MASTYTPILDIEKPAAGEQQGTWGTTLDTGLALLEAAIAGITDVSTTGGNTTLTTNQGSSNQARAAMLRVRGVLVANATITVPDRTKCYLAMNETTGAFTVSLKIGSNTIEVRRGQRGLYYCDGEGNLDIVDGREPGEVTMAMSSTPPIKHLACDATPASTIGDATSGATYAGAQYRALFEILKNYAALGNAGTEVFDSHNTVKLPVWRDRSPLAGTSAIGTQAGSNSYTPAGPITVDSHILDTTEIPSHSHAVGTLAVDSHVHGAGTYAVGGHTHAVGTFAVDAHSHAVGTLAVDSHTHGAGTYAVGGHTHAAGTYAISAHTHDNGTLAVDAHSHGAGTYAVGSHSHGAGTFVVTAAQEGTSVGATGGSGKFYASDGSRTVTGTSSAATPTFSGSSATATATISGATALATPTLSGASASTVPTFSGSSAGATATISGSTATSTATISGASASTTPTFAGSSAGATATISGSTATAGTGGGHVHTGSFAGTPATITMPNFSIRFYIRY
jgi:hypothetical protein